MFVHLVWKLLNIQSLRWYIRRMSTSWTWRINWMAFVIILMNGEFDWSFIGQGTDWFMHVWTIAMNEYQYFECIYSVRLNSIEFLRPVFLHVFCNPNQITNAESIWQAFFKQQRIKSSNAQILLQEMFTWCRVGLVLELQDTDYDDFYISRELIK